MYNCQLNFPTFLSPTVFGQKHFFKYLKNPKTRVTQSKKWLRFERHSQIYQTRLEFNDSNPQVFSNSTHLSHYPLISLLHVLAPLKMGSLAREVEKNNNKNTHKIKRK